MLDLPASVHVEETLAQQPGTGQVLFAALCLEQSGSTNCRATMNDRSPSTSIVDRRSTRCDIAVPADMVPALRSDHAGETGAVYIYRGIRAITRDPALHEFASQHQATEEHHLEIMNRLVSPERRSKLLLLWRVMGWITGALPALFGALAVYRTIDAVESFVDRHYREQIEALRDRPGDRALGEILAACRADELMHRDEARARGRSPGPAGRLWMLMVDAGSRAGVYVASRL